MATSPGSFRRPAVMRVLRADGEVRWLPAGFFSPEELATGGDDGAISPGPSLQIQAPSVSLSEEGEWVPAPAGDLVPAIVVDFQALSPVELDSFLGSFFVEGDPSLYPMASDTLRQARQWILAEGGLSSGYQTAASKGKDRPEPTPAAPEQRGPRSPSLPCSRPL